MYIQTKRWRISTGGFGIGTMLAILVSWGLNKSILWALIHGVFGWFYIAYWLLYLR